MLETVGLHKEEARADECFYFSFLSWDYEVLNDMQLEVDEMIAQTLYNSETEMWLIARWHRCWCFSWHILMIQFLRWTSSTSVTLCCRHVEWFWSLIIYESFWSILLGLSQRDLFCLILDSLLCVLFISSYSASKQICKTLNADRAPYNSKAIPLKRGFPLETLSLVSGFVAITCLEKEDKQKKASWVGIPSRRNW